DGARAVPVAEHDTAVVVRLVGPAGRVAGVRQTERGRARHRLGHREHIHRVAFRGVGVQQLRTGPAVQDGGQFPGQVVRVLYAQVAAEPAGGRHDVRGVTDEEDPPVLEAFGHQGTDLPRFRRHDDRVEPGQAGGLPDELDDPAGGKVVRSFVRLAGYGELPPAAVAGQQSTTGEPFDQADLDAAAPDRPGQVRLEQHAVAVAEDAGPVAADAEPLAYRTVRTVAGHQVRGADRTLLPGVDRTQQRAHAVGVLFEPDEPGGGAAGAATSPRGVGRGGAGPCGVPGTPRWAARAPSRRRRAPACTPPSSATFLVREHDVVGHLFAPGQLAERAEVRGDVGVAH